MNARVDLGHFLHTVPSFAGFGSQDLAALEQAMVLGQYPSGHEFISENRPNDQMYLIIEGEVLATRRRSKLRGTDVFDRLGPGELFGLTALADRRFPWATFRAVGPVTVASLPTNVCEMLFRSYARIAYCFQNLVAHQLAHRVRASVKALDALFDDKAQ